MTQLKTVRNKLTRITLVVSGLIGISTFSVVVTYNARTSARHLAEVEEYIEEGIANKGKVLTENHALALRSMTLDNAFGDMQRLVEHAVVKDPELVYGIYVGSERVTLAYSRQGEPPASGNPTQRTQPWEQLGLVGDELFVKEVTVRRVTRFERSLLEVAVPVLDDDGAALGTVRYGLSTGRMQEALAKANSDARDSLTRSMAWMASLLGAITLVGVLLSRMLAFRITRPIDALTRAARDLASGNRSVRVDIASGDELELLGSSFNHMVEELNTSYGKLEEMNRTLEHKVVERTAELAVKNRDMSLVLDNVDQGFATLSPEGRMAGGRSRVVSEWFGEGLDGAEFTAYIAASSTSFAESFDLGWAQLRDAFLPIELCLDQLPKELSARGRTWSFRYLPFFRDQQLDGVLIVTTEITLRLAREQEEAEQREIMQSFSRLMLDRAGFLNFTGEAASMVSVICSRKLEQDLPQLKRTLHTLKGNAAMMGLQLVANQCHLLEEEVGLNTPASEPALQELAKRWERIQQQTARFAPSGERALEVPNAEYSLLLSRLSQESVSPELLEQVRSWRLEPGLYPLERLAEQGRALAQRLGKGQLEVVVRAERVRLDPQKWRALFSELVHLVRNAIDHGIESPEERQRVGKTPGGRLLLSLQLSGGVLSFEVSDDGRGIDWESIAERGKARGLPCSTEAELLDVLCEDGISTRGEASDTSGRGVGMAAVKHCVEQLRGHLEVRSSNQGTCWQLHFPSRARPGTSQYPDVAASAPKSQAAPLATS